MTAIKIIAEYLVKELDWDRADFKTVARHGCASGAAPGLIYYHSTVSAYDDYPEEFHEVLGDWINGMDSAPTSLIDSIGDVYQFKNTVVWLVVNEVAYYVTEVDTDILDELLPEPEEEEEETTTA